MKDTKLLASISVLGFMAALNAGVFVFGSRANAQNCYPAGFGCFDWQECIPDIQNECAFLCEEIGSTCLMYRRIGPAQCDGHCYCYSHWALICQNGTQFGFDCYVISEGCYIRPPLLVDKNSPTLQN